MDTMFLSLEEASRVGDVDSLKRLLEEDKFLLERVIARTSARDNPLHIAALLGHVDFVGHIISRKPDLAKELNGQGLSPLHLAVAHGHLPVVKELLQAGFDLCFVREDKEGLMPLHVGVMKGRVLIVKELLEAREEAMLELTHSGETVLHLALKSNSLNMLEFLISLVNDLNAKDLKGNTVLHLAVARKQLHVIKLLLSNPLIDVNCLNSKAFTPLDVLLESPQEYGDLVIAETIRAAGGRTSVEIVPSQPNCVSSSNSSSTGPNKIWYSQSGFEKKTEKTNMEPQKKKKKYNTDILMLVAILVATITFQAGLNPPGGFIPADDKHQDDKGHVVLSEELVLFLFFDIVGLFSSISVILLLLCVVPRKRKIVIKFLVWVLWIATFSTALAFTLAIQVIYTSIFKLNDGSYFEYSDLSIVVLLIAWFIILRLGIVWVSIRIIVFLLKKGKLFEPIKEFVSFLVKGQFRWQRLDNATETTDPKTSSSSLRKTTCILLIVCVIISTVLILWGIYKIFHV